MTMNKVFQKAIKEHIAERSELFHNHYKGLKVIKSQFSENIECHDGTNMTIFIVTCSFKAEKWENNRVMFQVNIYDTNGEHTENPIGVYFNGEAYEA